MVAKTSLDSTIPLSFLDEKDAYLSSIPTFYQTDEALGTRTAASKILEEEGIGSPQDLIKSLGITSAKDIIEKEKQQTDALLQTNKQPEPIKPEEFKPEEYKFTIPKTGTLDEQRSSLQKQQEDFTTKLMEKQQAEQKAAEEKRKKEEEQKAAEYKLYTDSILKSVEDKRTALFSDPRNIDLAKDRYGFRVAAAKGPEGEQLLASLAGDPGQWLAASDEKEMLLYSTLTSEERQIYGEVKQQEFKYKVQEENFIKDFTKQLNSSYNINVVETPKLGTIDFSNVKEIPGAYLNKRPGVETGSEQYAKEIYQKEQEWLKKKEEIKNSNLPLVERMRLEKELGPKPRETEIEDLKKAEENKAKNNTKYVYELSNGYTFLPESVILNGANGAGGYHFNTAFLNKDTWKDLLETSQPIDLATVGQGIKVGDASLGRGYLFKKEDWSNFNNTRLEGNWKLNSGYNSQYVPDDQPIQGIGNVNGELVYVRAAGYKVGKDTINSAYIDKTGYARYSYTTKESGVRGVAQDLAEGFASIPFAPEIIGFATGSPAIYASLKGLQTAGQGGDMGDVLKSAAVAYAGAKVAANVGSYGQALGSNIASTMNIPVGAANFVGGAIVGSATQGVMAAVMGQDVEKAMLAGAIGGGASASASDFTNSVFGGEANVADLAKSVNLSPNQFSQIVTGSIANGAIAAAVYDKDFVDAFSQSLITQGLSTAAANTVAKKLGDSVSPAQRKAIAQSTSLFVKTAAHAAINNVDMDTAIKAVAPKAVADTLSIGLRESLKTTK